jgi:hypothetical protein
MSNQQEIRVLSRQSARELSQSETESVNGAFILFPRCTFNPVTCAIDGICSPEPAC